MDIYGYPAYQYNQSEELAKQMLAQQTLAHSMPFNRSPEPHNMPPPTGAPWNVEGMPWGMSSPPSVVQFTGHQPTNFTPPMVHCKRKSLDVEPPIPSKVLITEEKMAAHLSGLHISSNFTPHSLAEDVMDVGMEPMPSTSTGGNTSSFSLPEKLKGHTIVLSDELKQVKGEPLLPAALLDRLEKPRLSLVLWKPKEEILNIKEEKQQKKEEEESKKRNGVLVSEPCISEPSMDVEM